MSLHRGGLLYPNEFSPLLPVVALTVQEPASDAKVEGGHGDGDGARTRLNEAVARRMERLCQSLELLGSVPIFLVLGTLVVTFTLTLCTCIQYGHLARLEVPHDPLSSLGEKLEPWGPYTPYFPADEYQPPPKDCKVNQVNIIQRHGARFPTSGSSERIRGALARLQSAHVYLDPQLSFLKDYKYELGLNDLVSFGAFQSAQAGAEAYERYRKLVWKGNMPFVRASGSGRVIDSATNWTLGFAEANNYSYQPRLALILPEHLNDTLEDAMCPAAGNPEREMSIWTEIFAPPIAKRLNANAPGANLIPADIPALMSLCAFESVARETQPLSPFCNIFSPEEFEQYEYFSDLEKYYNRGYGQPLGPVQGVGYINELLARLQGNPVKDNTQTNRTLDSSSLTFPLGRGIYADFSHDNLMVAVMSALGLFKQEIGHLDPTKPDGRRTWFTNTITPFSARMVVERMQCKADHSRAPNEGWFSRFMKGKGKRKGQVYVRVLVNDAVQPLELCASDEFGLCTLDSFVESQAYYARHDGNGDFEKCFQEFELV